MSQNAKGKYVHKISTIYMKEHEITKMEFEEITEEEDEKISTKEDTNFLDHLLKEYVELSRPYEFN